MRVLGLALLFCTLASCSDNTGQLVERSESNDSNAVSPSSGSLPSPALPEGHPPLSPMNRQAMDVNPNTGGAPQSAVIQGDQAVVAGLSFKISPTWESQTPSSMMRAAQFALPPADGDSESAELALFPGSMGSVEMNMERWIGQFQNAGQPVREEKQIGPFQVHLLDISGTFDAGGMMMSQSTPKPDQRMLAAIVVSPGTTWYFKLTGPKATVAEWQPAFMELVDSLQPAN